MSYRAHKIITPNFSLPVAFSMVKEHLNMDDITDADNRITMWIRAAVANIENQYGMAMLTQTVNEYWSEFPASAYDPMLLRIQPVQSVASVQYVDTAGLTQTWDDSLWTFGGYNGATFITPNPGEAWPSTWKTPNAITVTYIAGFGDSNASVPEDIKHAIMLMVADYDQKREDSPQTFTRASENLLRPYYRWAA